MDKIRVVLADDQPIVRRGIALLLQEQGDIDVVGEASDGWEAVECAPVRKVILLGTSSYVLL